MANENVIKDEKNNLYKIMYKDKKGDEHVRDTVEAVPIMEDSETIKVFCGLVSEKPNARRAALSLLVHIAQYTLPNLQDWNGTGNKKTGQLAAELKDEFRKSEDAYFGQFMSKEHPQHKLFVARLPKINERGYLVEEEGKEQTRARLNYFMSQLRKDPSYSAAKNLFLNFWAFVGGLPYDEKKQTMIPPEAMRVLVANAKEVQEKDNSYATKLQSTIRELLVPANPDKPPVIEDDRLPMLVQDVKALLGVLESMATAAAERARQRVAPGAVVSTADDAVAKAQASTGRTTHALFDKEGKVEEKTA